MFSDKLILSNFSEVVKLMTCILDVPNRISAGTPTILSEEFVVFSVLLGKCKDTNSTSATTVSFHTLSNSLTNHPTIRCHGVRDTESNVK
jgi:hypothetical protein